ncbi:DNA polymerase III subunit gamma/tau [Candidatus Parcubacteria bacterium]|nr:DNA polymerase III subunit gamma/tau [Candidatus Parcubacteria bacterium]
MAILYRKYRPGNWEEVVNQNHIKITLTQEIAGNKTAHAYLFSGPRGVGKTTIARVLAKSVNCEKLQSGKYEPCGKCARCEEILAGRSLDIIEIDAASHTGVDNVRENIIAAARVASSRAKYKVFIIDEIHMLSISAFNALLKTLEEPPQNVIFILCTTEVHKIPATIISRCERFDFKRISVSDQVKKLSYIIRKENIKISKEILESVARHSEGHMRDAESLLGQIIAIGGKEISLEEADLVIPRSDIKEAINLLKLLQKKDAGAAIELVNKVIDEGVDLRRFVDDSIELIRKVMIIKINPSLADKLGLEMGESMEMEVNKIVAILELKQILDFIEALGEARNKINTSFISQLPIEIAIAKVCSSVRAGSPASPVPPPPLVSNPAPLVNNSTPPMASQARAANPTPTSISNQSSNVNIDSETIIAKWHEVLAKVKQHNHSLSFILRVCEPRDVNAGRICLAFKYKFHKERISENKIKILVEGVLKDVYGQNLFIDAIVDENIKTNGNGASKTQAAAPLPPKPVSQPSTPVPQQDGQAGKQDVSADSSYAKAADDKNNAIDNLLKTFGGKVVK